MELLETKLLFQLPEKKQQIKLASLPLIEELRQSSLNINNQNDFSRINLSNQDLEEIDLSGACLMGANLLNCNLRGANLEDCDLREANFQRSNLSGASLKGANCEKARFLRTNLRYTNLEGVNLQDAIIEEVKCKKTNLKKALLSSIDKANRRRIIKVRYSCFIPKGEYDYDQLLEEYQTQYNRLRKAATILILSVLFGCLKYLSFRFQI